MAVGWAAAALKLREARRLVYACPLRRAVRPVRLKLETEDRHRGQRSSSQVSRERHLRCERQLNEDAWFTTLIEI